MPDIDIVALGEPLVELNQTRAGEPQYQQGFGGDTSNAVIAAARQGARCAYLTRVGGDSFGAQLLELWKAEGVDTSGVEVDPDAHTGLYCAARPAGPFLQLPAARFRRQPHDAGQSQGPADRARPLPACLGISLAISTSACDTVFAAIERAHAAGVQVSLIPTCGCACGRWTAPAPSCARRYARPTCSCPAWTTCST